MVQMVKNLPAIQVTWVRSLGWEDPLEKAKAKPTPVFWLENSMHSLWDHKELDKTERLSLSLE